MWILSENVCPIRWSKYPSAEAYPWEKSPVHLLQENVQATESIASTQPNTHVSVIAIYRIAIFVVDQCVVLSFQRRAAIHMRILSNGLYDVHSLSHTHNETWKCFVSRSTECKRCWIESSHHATIKYCNCIGFEFGSDIVQLISISCRKTLKVKCWSENGPNL